MIDVMNTIGLAWAPSNTWFAPGFKNRESAFIDEISIYIMPLAYFIASKFEAFYDRGIQDPRTSHDFEDIIYVIDNRCDVIDVIKNSPRDVTQFLKAEFNKILNEHVKQEAILANLFYEIRDERYEMIMDKINRLAVEL